MQLLYSQTSPFARKVLVAAHEIGVADRLELVAVAVAPTEQNAAVSDANPLTKIPALILNDGSALYDSPVIVDYLNSLTPDHRVIPAEGPERWRALRLQALADGILDAALLRRYEQVLRPEPLRWTAWIEGQFDKVKRGLARLERESLHFSDLPMIGEITVGCALGYLDFRYSDEDWRSSHKELALWFERFATRPAMALTAPPTN